MTGETRKTEFAGATGEKLAAALELPARPRAFALFAHCFSCTKDIKAAREIARALRAEGFAVMRFDFTGLGHSEGDFANTNFSSNIDDLVAAADFLRNTYEAPQILIGHSLGGAAAIVAASRIREVKGVAVIAAPAEADHIALQIGESRAEIEEKGFATVQLAGRPFTIKKQFLDDLGKQNVLTHAANLKKPLLIMHAPLDKTVGIDNATKIFIAAKHPKSFVSLDTADHLLSNTEDARYAPPGLGAISARRRMSLRRRPRMQRRPLPAARWRALSRASRSLSRSPSTAIR
jgi:putative redox protein